MALGSSQSVLQVGVLFFVTLNGLISSKELKDFTFVKEHDGSLAGIEGGIQQIKLAGIFPIYYSCNKIFSFRPHHC